MHSNMNNYYFIIIITAISTKLLFHPLSTLLFPRLYEPQWVELIEYGGNVTAPFFSHLIQIKDLDGRPLRFLIKFG